MKSQSKRNNGLRKRKRTKWTISEEKWQAFVKWLNDFSETFNMVKT
jgi:hypothetical protein